VIKADDGRWHARFETREQHTEPESNIAAMLAVVDVVAAGASLRITLYPSVAS
jgi:hypothetical protein